ncbi:rRNA accumulation-related protein [Paraconiothyrium brasiliense]|uniref:rRNA accumulation-related protein n=1 Tax=Paraconiothyrium brasiliense TaxID=300254 RepID=A0ABR3S0K5_9PLEO
MATSSASTALSEQQQAKFDLGIWYTLFNWPTLTVAVQNQWGGPDSSDKRDWLAGAVSDLFSSEPLTDQEDIEVMLLQVLEDEFGTRLEDETEVGVARDIMAIRIEVQEGNFATVDALEQRWQSRKGKEVSTGSVQVKEVEQEGEWDSVDEETDDDEDEVMRDPPAAAAPPKEKPAPEVDEDGFTKVVGKKRR